MKKIICFILAAVFASALLSGCTDAPAAPQKQAFSLTADACLSPLAWGMTRSEAEQALAGYALTSAGEGFTAAAELFGQTVTAAVHFELLTNDNSVVPVPEQTEPVLVGIDLFVVDYASFKEELTAALGAQAERQTVYYEENGAAGIKDGAELPEEARYWRSDVTLTDLFTLNETGKVDFVSASDRLRYEDKRAWVVTTAPVDGGTAFVFDGHMLAVRAALDRP